eukprot:Tamp_12372.p2 GENE.Tamp_12372~~Tamp_12372.p2  ORF type:complete len:168 (+),score=5.84 Tamp_12372:719-1222(+)
MPAAPLLSHPNVLLALPFCPRGYRGHPSPPTAGRVPDMRSDIAARVLSPVASPFQAARTFHVDAAVLPNLFDALVEVLRPTRGGATKIGPLSADSPEVAQIIAVRTAATAVFEQHSVAVPGHHTVGCALARELQFKVTLSAVFLALCHSAPSFRPPPFSSFHSASLL